MKQVLILISFVLLSCAAFGQDGGDTLLFPLKYKKGLRYVFKTVAGTTHTGYVVEETRDLVTIENRSIHEKMEIRKSEIISAKLFADKKAYEDDILGENYHASSYLFSGSAFEFEEGAVISQNHWLIFQNVSYGLSDNWAVTTNAIAFYPMSLGLKCAYRIGDASHIGFNVFGMGNLLESDKNRSILYGYGASARYTYGSTNKNLSIAAGLLGLKSEVFFNLVNPPFVNLAFVNMGYCNRFSPNVAFVAEGWYLPATQSLIGGLGVKLVGNEMYSWSFGCYTFLDPGNNNTFGLTIKSIPIPYLGIGRKFN